jgi:hypothetical protein
MRIAAEPVCDFITFSLRNVFELLAGTAEARDRAAT